MQRRVRVGIAVAMSVLVAGSLGAQSPSSKEKERIAGEIRAIHEDVAAGFNAHDAARILRHIEKRDDLRYVEHTQVTVGWETLRKGFEPWHRENGDLTIAAGTSHVNVLSNRIAVLTASGTILKSGRPIQMMTWTAVFRLSDGGWKIASAHEAVSDIAPTPPQKAASGEELRAQVRKTEEAFARTMARRDAVAFAGFIAPDAVFLGQEALRGRNAVVAGWARYFEGPDAPFSWAPESVEVIDSGNLAISKGPVFDPQGTRSGTFVFTWRREADGEWRIVLDTGCPPCSPKEK